MSKKGLKEVVRDAIDDHCPFTSVSWITDDDLPGVLIDIIRNADQGVKNVNDNRTKPEASDDGPTMVDFK